MILLLILLILSVAGIVICRKTYDDVLEAVSGIIGYSSAIFLIGALVAIPLCRSDVLRDIEKMEAFRSTLQSLRSSNISEYERVAFAKEIAQWNELLAGCKYNNSIVWDLWIPDAIDQIEPIK